LVSITQRRNRINKVKKREINLRKNKRNSQLSNHPKTIGFSLILALWFAVLFVSTAALYAQDANNSIHQWTYLNRVIITGSSDHSDPKNYKVYSAFTMETVIRWQFSSILVAEVNVKTESREVDVTDNARVVTNLESIELLPINLIIEYHPPVRGGIHPYIGIGGNFTLCWEKSGVLDNKDLTPSLGPALQLGADFDLASYIVFNIDIKWNRMRTDIEENGTKIVSLKLDPINFGTGLGFRF